MLGEQRRSTKLQVYFASTKPPFLTWPNAKTISPFFVNLRAFFWVTFHNWFPSSVMKIVISKVTGCFLWLFTSQRTHLGIWVDKNVSSAWCLFFQYGIFPWSPNLGENAPLESRRKRKQTPPGANVPCPVLKAVCLQRESTLGRQRGLSVGARRRFSTTMASSHLASGSSPASLRFFYSVPSHILLGKWAISKGVRWL